MKIDNDCSRQPYHSDRCDKVAYNVNPDYLPPLNSKKIRQAPTQYINSLNQYFNQLPKVLPNNGRLANIPNAHDIILHKQLRHDNDTKWQHYQADSTTILAKAEEEFHNRNNNNNKDKKSNLHEGEGIASHKKVVLKNRLKDKGALRQQRIADKKMQSHESEQEERWEFNRRWVASIFFIWFVVAGLLLLQTVYN